MYNRLTKKPLPPYAFLPGFFPHPEKEGGHGFGLNLNTVSLNQENYRDHQEYLYGIDLLNLGFMWESHVYFEAIWNQNLRKGQEAELLKALIKIGAAGIKFRLKMFDAGNGHLHRATELFQQLPSLYLGIRGIEFLNNLQINESEIYPFNKHIILDLS